MLPTYVRWQERNLQNAISQPTFERQSSSSLVDPGRDSEARLALLLDDSAADWPLTHLRYLYALCPHADII